ncbi:Acetamidase regulatory protein [Paramyrothecium foliicola]|nr:Acetamidase regulatory protein [Paramyrothecium foliicola]
MQWNGVVQKIQQTALDLAEELTAELVSTAGSARNQPECRIYEAKKRKSEGTSVAHRKLKAIRPCRGAATGHDPQAASSPQSLPTTSRHSSTSPQTLSEIEPAKDDEHVRDTGNIAEFLDREEARAVDIDNTSRNCYVGTGISNFNYLVRQSTVRSMYNDCFHFANRQFHPSLTSFDLHCMPSEALERPSKPLADKLIDAYFEVINRGWPIIDEEDFRAKYAGQDPRNPLPLQLLNAVFLVGAHVLSAQDRTMRKLQVDFFRRAKILMDFRYEQDRMSHVQAALLLSWYSDGQEELMANAWHWIGLACRLALGMGMHRDTSASRLLSTSKRAWPRLWWVLFQFDTLLSTAYGRPQALDVDESDIPELEPRHFQGIPSAEVDFVVQHTRLCIILSKFAKKRWALRSSVTTQIEATRQADEALAHFLSQLPPSLRVTPSHMSTWQATLHLTYNNTLLQLHRPPPKQSALDSPLHVVSDATICGEAGLVMTTVYDALLAQGTLSHLWLHGIHALFTAIVHATNGLNSSNPVVAAKAFRMFNTLLAALRELSRYWQFAFNLLSLFEKRLLRARHTSLENHAPSDSQVVDESEGQSGFALRPVPPVTGHLIEHATVSSESYQEGPLGQSDVFPPLDDILLNNPISFDDPALIDLLIGFEGSEGYSWGARRDNCGDGFINV